MTKYPKVFKKGKGLFDSTFKRGGSPNSLVLWAPLAVSQHGGDTGKELVKYETGCVCEWGSKGVGGAGLTLPWWPTGQLYYKIHMKPPPPWRQSWPDYLLLAPPLIGLSDFQFVLFRNQASSWVGRQANSNHGISLLLWLLSKENPNTLVFDPL